jgi:CheY-like chemotaxis protein
LSGSILVVEDDRELRDSLCDALLLEGYQVVCVEDGQAALRHLRSSAPPCLILLDLMMPVMDGWAFREEMLQDPALADIPVVVMTAAGNTLAEKVPARRVLHKPLHMDTVVEVVQRHCPDPAS